MFFRNLNNSLKYLGGKLDKNSHFYTFMGNFNYGVVRKAKLVLNILKVNKDNLINEYLFLLIEVDKFKYVSKTSKIFHIGPHIN